MKVAVIILNWNGRRLLEQFLPSVVNFSENEATIYVADNASTDDSVLYVQENFSNVKIIQNTTNGGYAKGYNDALKNLTEDLFVLLNSDVEVTENWLTPIISEFKKDFNLVAAQPKILDFKNKEYFEYAGAAGGFIDKLGYPFCRGRVFDTLEKNENQYNDTIEIFWATGACLFVRKKAFEKVRGLDEDFFAHQEEIDLCWRLKSKGGKIKCIGNSTVFHVGGATLSAADSKKTFYNFRNTLLMLLKNVKGSKVLLLIFTRLLLDGLAGIQFIFQGKWKHALAIIKAHFSFYSLIPTYLKKRRKIASNLKYYKTKSIVLDYYLRKKRTFINLN
ncbi:MAG: dTDP-Rha--alpha-D-GlcNAc-pyrophosphate polyprenol alpha-3-L-rhamnosyltransferase [Flavobacterium sp.]|nr:MAG: dTDP-Rha--alpha-D-GlcNAc-pyrophosphate polyprenol alpha-3-L-rhamnosyltransferase [Flavobacterium sp.]